MTYLLRYGYQAANRPHFDTFDEALKAATKVLAGGTPRYHEAPTIRNVERADEDSDGLTEEERERCEATGIEVTRP